MASGLAMCRINRPNIWLHRPAKITKSILAKTEPSTYGPLPPVHDWLLSKAQRPVLRFVPELAASACRVVVIGARWPAGDDPIRIFPALKLRWFYQSADIPYRGSGTA